MKWDGLQKASKGRKVLKGYSSSTKLVIKLSLEFMPLALFFLASTKYGFATSTAVLMVATVVSLIVTWYLFRQLALMAIITAATGIRPRLSIIPYNPIAASNDPFRRTSEARERAFRDILSAAGLPHHKRYSGGADVAAACGQLAARG